VRALPYRINSEGVIEDNNNNAEAAEAALVKCLEEAKRAHCSHFDPICSNDSHIVIKRCNQTLTREVLIRGSP
jgi:hypothetical protein